MSSTYQPLSSADTFVGSSTRIEATITAMGMDEWIYMIYLEGTVGTFTTARCWAEFQTAPDQIAGLSLGQQSTVIRRPWLKLDPAGPNAKLLLDGDWPDPLPIGVPIYRRCKLGGPYRARVVIRQSFTGQSNPASASHVITSAMELRWASRLTV